MANAPRLWVGVAHHPKFLCGGWAAIGHVGAPVTGIAGGERHTTARRMALAGLAAGLRDLPSTAQPIHIEMTTLEATAIASVLAGRQAGPEDDLDLWAPILTAAGVHRLSLHSVVAQPDSPAAFAAAWADFAMEKAQARGAFTSPIPRLNLAKLSGLA